MATPPCPKLAQAARVPAARRGFTLIELLTVIAIIGVLMAILVPTVGMIQVSARKAKSTSNLRSIGQALKFYATDHNNLLPAPIYGASTVPGDHIGSSNPRGGTWLEELIGGNYVDGAFTAEPGSTTIDVTRWDPVLTDPQFLASNSVISDPDVRGYGMNTKPFLADKDATNRDTAYATTRQSLNKLPNLANNVVLGTSNDVSMEPDPDGKFPRNAAGYTNGDPGRYQGIGLFLFLDNSVQPLTEDELAKILSTPNT